MDNRSFILTLKMVNEKDLPNLGGRMDRCLLVSTTKMTNEMDYQNVGLKMDGW